MLFEENGTFKKYIGSYAENYKGTYTVDVQTNSIIFTFETGKTMKGSYDYENGKIVSVKIIENYNNNDKYSVTLEPRDDTSVQDYTYYQELYENI